MRNMRNKLQDVTTDRSKIKTVGYKNKLGKRMDSLIKLLSKKPLTREVYILKWYVVMRPLSPPLD